MDSRTRSRTSINPASAILWTCAFALAALVIVQAGKLPGNPAYAEMGVESEGFTLVTASSGRGDDADPYELLYVLDSRDEVLLVYEIEDARQKQVVFRYGHFLPAWFRTARR
ncbi:MAG: hypothetical protein HKO59_02855 [Phycisphaerales bacterium]|nr:hypothetical protein [Phycisphaerae bacterium]NNF43113.1 hypothetical protein [Phycisphaerales bacterium]NNM24921.1 hypothetical protein [Phycisphaerales bacterium]